MTDIVERLQKMVWAVNGPGADCDDISGLLTEAKTEIETLRAELASTKRVADLTRRDQDSRIMGANAEIETLRADAKAKNERDLEIVQGFQSTIQRLNEGYDKITAVMAELGFGTWTDPDGTEWSLHE